MKNVLFELLQTKNHAESFRNFFKKQISNPKHAQLNPNSDFGHVLCVFRPDSGGHPQSEFGRIRTAVPNLSSAGFGRPSHIWVRPDSDGRPQSAPGDDSRGTMEGSQKADCYLRQGDRPLKVPLKNLFFPIALLALSARMSNQSTFAERHSSMQLGNWWIP